MLPQTHSFAYHLNNMPFVQLVTSYFSLNQHTFKNLNTQLSFMLNKNKCKVMDLVLPMYFYRV